MRGAVLRRPGGSFSVEELVLGPPRPDEVVVDVVACGMCHSDLLHRHGYDVPAPLVLGHEGSGIVRELGAAVDDLAVGDHVVLTFDCCGRCAACLRGRPAHCRDFLPLNNGGSRADGTTALTDADGGRIGSHWFGQSSFAERAVVRRRSVVAVDKSLPLEMLGPLGCGLQSGAGTVLNSPHHGPGTRVLVTGAGAVGIAAVMAAAASGCTEVIAVDPLEHRRALAVELGATAALAPSDDVYADIAATTGGVDLVVETTGVPAVIEAALGAVALGGTLANLGAPRGPVSLLPTALIGRSMTYVLEGDAVPQVFVPTLLGLWRTGRFPFDRLIETYPLAGIDDAAAASESGAVVKPVVLM